jgi:minor extracellular serine protease Vpr
VQSKEYIQQWYKIKYLEVCMLKLRKFRNIIGLLMTVFLLLALMNPVFGMMMTDDDPSVSQNGDYAFVRFTDDPIASYNGGIKGYEATKPSKGEKLNLDSPAAKKYGNRLEAKRDNYKDWLAKQYPHVGVVTEYAITYNGIGLKLNGATLKQISAGPGSVEVGFSATYQKAMSTSTGLIKADSIWSSLGGQENAGAGIMVGVIDSGVDQSHPFLQPNEGMELPDNFPKGDFNFTSNKVIVAKVFHQEPWHTPEAVGSHGTHVAGTIAGKAGTIATGAGEESLSGVAPGAYLGNYNVFPGNVGSAYSLFIAKAVEEAVADGMDVLNLSLGGSPHKGADLLDMAVNSAVDAGLVVAVAAGNSGPGDYTVGSPGTADKVITVAATTNSRTFAMFLESVALENGKTVATTGTDGAKVKEQIPGEYEVWAKHAGGDKLACSSIEGEPLTGKIALIQRGACTFTTKINNAAAAGASAVIIYQLDGVNEPIPMSSDGAKIPAIMIGNDAGNSLIAEVSDRAVTITYPPSMVEVTPNLLANFSSWGPTPNYTLKPDVAAPGVNILSSIVGGGYELYQGTSMATPHVAGSAAVLFSYSKQNNLGWGPEDIKAALMGTAQGVAGSVLPNTDYTDSLKVGAGLIDLSRAMNPPSMVFPSSLSFGLVRPTGDHVYTLTFTLENTTNGMQTYTLGDDTDTNLSFSTNEVTLESGQSVEIKATVENRGEHLSGQSGTPEFVKGYIPVQSQAGDIRIPYFYVIDYNR